MFGYILVAFISILVGGTADHYLVSFEACEERTKSITAREEFLAHLDSMKDKSEIMVRHDARAFRDRLSGK